MPTKPPTQLQRMRALRPQPKPRDTRPSPYRRGYGGKRWASRRKAVWVRDGGICQACGRLVYGKWICDHIVPKDQGGTDEIGNLRVMHPGCHNRKHKGG